ncbi:MAG TPA: hypothetical protein VEC37_17660, partial [Bacillota bacterium]|nr:hypothetical protein [Bacillota bacterium]
EYELKLSKKQEVEVVKYFNNKIKNGTLVELKSGKKSAYKLKTDYNLFTNNCTTITLDSLPNDLQKDIGDYFAPLDLDVNLKVMSKWSEQVKVGKYYEKETTKIKSREDERKKK